MEQPIKTSLKTLQVIYGALVAGVFSFLMVSLVINYSVGPFAPDPQLMRLFIIITYLAGVASIIGGIFLARKRFENIPPQLSTDQGLDYYRSAMILRVAMMEGSGFFFIVANLLFSNIVFIIGAFISLATMMIYFPTKSRIENETGMTLQ